MIVLEPREQTGPWLVVAAPLLAVACTVVAGTLLFLALGHSPLLSLFTFFIKPVLSWYGFGELLLKATPLIIIACGLALGFRANVWNIGAEGQFTIGAIAAGGLAIYFHDSDAAWLLPGMLLAGIAGGMAWGAIPALLKTRFNTNEILTSLMLVYVALLLLSYLVHGPWRDPDGFNFPESRLFPPAAQWARAIPGTRLHNGAFLVPVVVFATWIVLSKTRLGFELKAAGQAPSAMRYAGFSPQLIVWTVLLIGGGLAGLAGMLEVAGPVGQLTPSISPGYGFTAIIVAFTGRLHPFGIVFAGLLVALSFLGGELVQIDLGMPLAVSGVFQGMLLFFLLACEVMVNYRVKWRRR